MNREEGIQLLEPFKKAALRDEDPFFVCHFSRVDDKFAGAHDGMDKGDAMILIQQLVKDFNINLEVMAAMNDEL